MSRPTLADSMLAAVLDTPHRRGWPDPCPADRGSIDRCTCEVASCYRAAERARTWWTLDKRRGALARRPDPGPGVGA